MASNWIRKSKRLAIYLRDGLACCYCGQSVEDGVELTLDHCLPRSKSDTPNNSARNLITACGKCNSSRGNRPVAEFVRVVAAYTGRDAREIHCYIKNTRRKKINHLAARRMIEERGYHTCTKEN